MYDLCWLPKVSGNYFVLGSLIFIIFFCTFKLDQARY